MSCCNPNPNKSKTCRRITDGKLFDLPRRFTRKECVNEKIRGFTMRSSCAPYKGCKKGGKKENYNKEAVATISVNNNGITGNVLFKQSSSSSKKLKITYEIYGLTDGKHGFHIHEYGDLTDGCKSACSHFKPTKNSIRRADLYSSGSMTDKDRNSSPKGANLNLKRLNPFGKNHGNHAGDLGNVISKNGISKGVIYSKILSIDFSDPTCIVGRMIIVHKDEDDLGLGDNEESLITGNAGERVACGVIGLKHA